MKRFGQVEILIGPTWNLEYSFTIDKKKISACSNCVFYLVLFRNVTMKGS